MLRHLYRTTPTRTNRVSALRAAIVLAVLSALLPGSLGPGPAYAAPGPYNCPLCYGATSWEGASFGAATYIYVQPLTCDPCDTINHYQLNEQLWLQDSVQSTRPYIDVGYGYRNGGLRYFWGTAPPEGGQQIYDIATVPSADYGNFAGFKITRNRQASNQVLVQVWNAATNWSTVVTNGMGSATWTGNHTVIGAQLMGNSHIAQSTNGAIAFINNQWQSNDGVYHFQASDPGVGSDVPLQAYWHILPSHSTTGGELYTSCGC